MPSQPCLSVPLDCQSGNQYWSEEHQQWFYCGEGPAFEGCMGEFSFLDDPFDPSDDPFWGGGGGGGLQDPFDPGPFDEPAFGCGPGEVYDPAFGCGPTFQTGVTEFEPIPELPEDCFDDEIFIPGIGCVPKQGENQPGGIEVLNEEPEDCLSNEVFIPGQGCVQLPVLEDRPEDCFEDEIFTPGIGCEKRVTILPPPGSTPGTRPGTRGGGSGGTGGGAGGGLGVPTGGLKRNPKTGKCELHIGELVIPMPEEVCRRSGTPIPRRRSSVAQGGTNLLLIGALILVAVLAIKYVNS